MGLRLRGFGFLDDLFCALGQIVVAIEGFRGSCINWSYKQGSRSYDPM